MRAFSLLVALLFFVLGLSRAQTTISYSGAITTFTVLVDGTYLITAAGAQGGTGQLNTAAGGLGAMVSGSYVLSKDTVLQIVVGGSATQSPTPSGGGGGGTFAFIEGVSQPLIVAGGGGGSSFSVGGAGQSGTAGQDGGGAPAGGSGGSSGAGGGGGISAYTSSGGGGAGWSGDGGNGNTASPLEIGGDGGHGPASSSPFAGGAGGTYFGSVSAAGGFGGGGGAGYPGSGGGGGYSGGGGGSGGSGGTGIGGGGGGSYLDAAFTGTTLTVGANSGNGYIMFTLVAKGGEDPSFTGFAGQRFCFHGKPNQSFHIYSDPYISINSRFVLANPSTRKGTVMYAFGIQWENHTVTFGVDSAIKNNTAVVLSVDGIDRVLARSKKSTLFDDCIAIAWWFPKLTLTTPLHRVVIDWHTEQTAHINGSYLNIGLRIPIEFPSLYGGVLGQTASIKNVSLLSKRVEDFITNDDLISTDAKTNKFTAHPLLCAAVATQPPAIAKAGHRHADKEKKYSLAPQARSVGV